MTKRIAVPAWPVSWMVRSWRVGDGDTRCQQCTRLNPCWWVEAKIWNEVMGSEAGVLCPTCFLVRCDEKGVGRTGAWQLYPPANLR